MVGPLTRSGLGRLAAIERRAPVRRYQRARPGERLHLDIRKLARFDGGEQMEPALLGPDLGNVDPKEADGIGADGMGLERRPRLGTLHLRQSADLVALQSAMEGRARQMRDGRLERVEAVIERQQGMAAESDSQRLFLFAENRGAAVLRPHRRVITFRD